YMAYLQGQGKHFCGGFLVAPSWVMTAAQCLAYKPLTVILGAHTIQKKEESWQTFGVKEYHRHPDFKSREEGNDILLLKLDGNATINRHVRTIALQDKHSRCTKGSVVGWGNEKGNVTLREATVTVLSQMQCISYNLALRDGMVCASSESNGIPGEVSPCSGRRRLQGSFWPGAEQKGQEDPCGDAGDPLVCNRKAYGIFSYRHSSWPGFYTHICFYIQWVNRVMK
ncbi:GRAF protein, partial [Climacteris rufus]|nr:GRAF protein [Climacteris rufus]